MNRDFIYLSARHAKPSHINLPGSKSISNRVLLLAALSDNSCEIHSLLQSDDTQRMQEALIKLGIHLHTQTHNSLIVNGHSGTFAHTHADLFLGNAGTAFRPLTAILAILGGDYHLHGIERMHQRPIGDLVDALRLAGAKIDYLKTEGYPPLKIGTFHPSGLHHIPIKGTVSSQFLSSLLMALPLTQQSYQIEIEGDLISKPYIDITLNLLKQFGINIQNNHYQNFHIPAHSHYHAPSKIYVEGDASSASYFLAAGLLSATPIRVCGVGKNAIQGDIAFAYELEKIGANIIWGDNFIEISRDKKQKIQSFSIDANTIPDAAMTLCIVALASDAPCRISNIASWRVKETDRIAAMATELRKVGAIVHEEIDAITIIAPKQLTTNAHIDTYDDHRIAMCFSLVSLLGVDITINDPQCTHKTFPEYFQIFENITVAD